MSRITQKPAMPNKPVERRTGHTQTEGQRYASSENFCLFLLRGVQASMQNPRAALILNPALVDTVVTLFESEVKRIKAEQEIRKEGRE